MEAEKRAEKGGDGVAYTFADFVQFYGAQDGKRRWERCAPKSKAKAKAVDRATTGPLVNEGNETSPSRDASRHFTAGDNLKHANSDTIASTVPAEKAAAAPPAAKRAAPAAAKAEAAPAAPAPAAAKKQAPAAAATSKPAAAKEACSPSLKKGDHDVVQKVVVVGNSGAGKTCLLRRFADDTFEDTYQATVGVDFKFKTIQANQDTKVKIQVWDTAGAERFRHITAAYYRGAHGIAIVYDTTDAESLAAVESWHTEVNQYLDTSTKRILIGNKCDLNDSRKVSQEEGKLMAEKFCMLFAETSAKTAANVDEAFKTLACDVLASMPKKEKKEVPKSTSTQRLGRRNEPARQSDGGCCG
jgi:Ras-related protein Rab-1A